MNGFFKRVFSHDPVKNTESNVNYNIAINITVEIKQPTTTVNDSKKKSVSDNESNIKSKIVKKQKSSFDFDSMYEEVPDEPGSLDKELHSCEGFSDELLKRRLMRKLDYRLSKLPYINTDIDYTKKLLPNEILIKHIKKPTSEHVAMFSNITALPIMVSNEIIDDLPVVLKYHTVERTRDVYNALDKSIFDVECGKE